MRPNESFCTAKETINTVKRQPSEWGEYNYIWSNWQRIIFRNIHAAHAAEYQENIAQSENRKKIQTYISPKKTYRRHAINTWKPHCVGCLCVLLMVSFAVQELLSLIRSRLLVFVFICITLGQRSQHFWHQGLASWKMIFPQTRCWGWEHFQDDSSALHFLCTFFYCY